LPVSIDALVVLYGHACTCAIVGELSRENAFLKISILF
jgi:hypothetical protein